MDQRFRKHEHLKSRKLIEQLFKAGHTIKAFPLLAVYMPFEDLPCVQVGFSVSKRKVRLAANRNTLKRRMREAYRLNRDLFKMNEQTGLAVMFIYIRNEDSAYPMIEKSMTRILQKLTEIERQE